MFQLDIDDFKGWAQGLRKAGYATDPRYPQKLISLIKRYDLDKYDDQALEGMNVVKSSKVKPEVMIDDKNVHVVKAGDTLYALSVKYKTTIVELKRLNKLNTNNLTIGQVLKVK